MELLQPETGVCMRTQVETMICELERQMPDLQRRNTNVFALANAWAERHDAILAMTPLADRPAVQDRLCRIGIRWGVMPGARVTREFHALASLDAATELRRKA